MHRELTWNDHHPTVLIDGRLVRTVSIGSSERETGTAHQTVRDDRSDDVRDPRDRCVTVMRPCHTERPSAAGCDIAIVILLHFGHETL